MPIGYLVAVVLVALCTWLAVVPIRRPRALGELSFRLGFLVNEQPFLAGYLALASTLLAAVEGDLDSPVGWCAFGIAVVATVGLAVIVRRQLETRTTVDRALRNGLGDGW
jgi:hypothetical protein